MIGCRFCFGSISSFFLELFLHSSPVAYWAWEFIFQCHIFLPFHPVQGVFKARILKWFAILFSSGPRFVRTLHHDPVEPEIKLPTSVGSLKKQKDRTLKDELPRSVGAQYGTGDQWRNNSRKNEEMEPKQKQHPAVDVTDDGSKA